jgi:chaperonin GroES
MPNHKHFFVPGDDVSPEQLQSIRDLEARQSEELNTLLASIPKKAVPEFMNPPFKPYEDRILIFPDPVEIKTQSGIIVPESVTDKLKPMTGTVVRVGEGKDGKAIPIAEGDRIYYGAFAGTDFEIAGITYKIMRFADCFGRAL